MYKRNPTLGWMSRDVSHSKKPKKKKRGPFPSFAERMIQIHSQECIISNRIHLLWKFCDKKLCPRSKHLNNAWISLLYEMLHT